VEHEEILLRLRERILAFATSRFRKEAAEDLAQETLLLLHEKYGHIWALEDLLPLAFRILRYKAAAAWRKARRRGESTAASVEEEPLLDLMSNPGRMAENQELLRRMKEAFSRLGSRCRELFIYKIDGMDFGEIQRRMGAASLNTVYTWDHRCRQRLRELLGDPWTKY